MNPRIAFIAAPLLVLAYGVIRILDGLDGSRGPGLAWTSGHIAFMAARSCSSPPSCGCAGWPVGTPSPR